MDTPTVSALISFGVLILSIVQTVRQGNLAKATAALEVEVSRLGIERNQSLLRLERARELANQLQLLVLGIFWYQRYRPRKADPDWAIQAMTCRTELAALASTIGDSELCDLTQNKLESNLDLFKQMPKSANMEEAISDFKSTMMSVYEAIYRLLEQETKKIYKSTTE